MICENCQYGFPSVLQVVKCSIGLKPKKGVPTDYCEKHRPQAAPQDVIAVVDEMFKKSSVNLDRVDPPVPKEKPACKTCTWWRANGIVPCAAPHSTLPGHFQHGSKDLGPSKCHYDPLAIEKPEDDFCHHHPGFAK